MVGKDRSSLRRVEQLVIHGSGELIRVQIGIDVDGFPIVMLAQVVGDSVD